MPKTKKPKLTYRCMVGITHDPTDTRWEAGDTLRDGDLPARVIEHFLTMTPPVLILVDEVENGQSWKE